MTPPTTRPAVEDDVDLAYRLILGRPVDAAGHLHYTERLRAGLTINDLVRELQESEEFRSKAGIPNAPSDLAEPAAAHDSEPGHALISPADVIATHSLADLIETADEYYRRIPDPTPLLVKPFFFLNETPEILYNLGAVLDGLRLGKAMSVLDFGGGTGWLSRLLAQLNCQVICCDVSQAALALAQRLFTQHPPIGHFTPPRFLPFDGETLELADESVDRIISFDAFHHVPNPERVIHEFGRVLKRGGVAGFSEPGPRHSASAQSQYEMRHHRVLENDIRIDLITAWASDAGFSDVRIRMLAAGMTSPDVYADLTAAAPGGGARSAAVDAVRRSMLTQSIFFLDKGAPVPDSRSHEGLAHEIVLLSPATIDADGDGRVDMRLRLKNTGTSIWLNAGDEIYGLVRVGMHLYGADDRLLNLDFSRHDLPRRVMPGESIEVAVTIDVPGGAHTLVIDLVAEGVTWFENAGSKTATVSVRRGN